MKESEINLIEKLKGNEAHRIFADMSEEEQYCLISIGSRNCQFLAGDKDEIFWKSNRVDVLYQCGIYRIDPDYPPEPEFEDIEVKNLSNVLQLKYGLTYYRIHELPSLPNFEGFWCINSHGEEVAIHIIDVANRMHKNEGKKVYARFRK